jgi:CRISPR-associated protein Cmr6
MNQHRNNRNNINHNPKSDRSFWEAFLDKLKEEKRKFKQDENSLYDLLKNSQLQQGDDLTIYVSNEDLCKKVNSKRESIKKQLFQQNPHWNGKRIYVQVGQSSPSSMSIKINSDSSVESKRAKQMTSPLQALNHTLFESDRKKDEALKAAIAAEKKCTDIYKQLSERTNYLATESFEVEFIWRVRVGGMRGFQELLLPVFHPIYGVPYIPASSLKGIVRDWARKHKPQADVERLLGTLDDGIGCVQILEAFPTSPCLSIDMANPQWHWQKDNHGHYTKVKYKSEPHAVLSMYKPKMTIGLTKTARGTKEDVATVKEWLEKALTTGIGSRVSSGYGRIKDSSGDRLNSDLSHSSKFKLWTQGMYGATPPSPINQWQGEAEFRPSAVRGMLRYWFRAVGLGIYSVSECKDLESELFGTIEPKSKEGKIRIAVDWIDKKGDRNNPHFYEGKILIEAKGDKELALIEKLLQLSSHLAGIGRGSRRPLHWNNPHPGLRGCHWELTEDKLPCDSNSWTQFLNDLRSAFTNVTSPSENVNNCSPGQPNNRYQDVLNQNAAIYLVPHNSSTLKHPSQVKDWKTEGINTQVRGTALDLLYQNRFKGVNQAGVGNRNVGGAMETPSYVLIQSNFPESKPPYQVVTIFGANDGDRTLFANEISRLQNVIKVM